MPKTAQPTENEKPTICDDCGGPVRDCRFIVRPWVPLPAGWDLTRGVCKKCRGIRAAKARWAAHPAVAR